MFREMKNSPNNKQQSNILEIPEPISASHHDLSYAINSFKPGSYTLADLPERLPIISKTGKIRMFYNKKKSDSRRVVSMPEISHFDFDAKTLNSFESSTYKSKGRAISMFNTEKVPRIIRKKHILSIAEEEDEREEGEEESERISTIPMVCESLSNDVDILKIAISDPYRRKVLQNNIDTDSISDFEVPNIDNLSIYTSSLTSSQQLPGELETNTDTRSESSSVYDELSFIDSLFDSCSEKTQDRNSIGSANSDSSPVQLSDLNQKPSLEFPLLNLNKYRTYKKPEMLIVSKTRPVSTNLDNSKDEMKAYVRQRPFSYCLDNPDNYNYSRFHNSKS